ncbi:uncharacterized protein LOC127707508 [Mytilus californianus]|uniref:uncharacterized protein LOC127707508 n=1 Tax=Mytilus californianus TaxID=6549 RepID=UPI00224745CE|nr:uncharacterized protein LOC127707508 [Mytilus californianus]
MKQVWTVFVLFLYIYGIDKFLLTRAEQKILYPSAVPDTITCAKPAVIQVEKADIVGENSTCSNECVLSQSDFETIKVKCNDFHECTVDFPNDTSCLRENRYFHLSYSCLVPTNKACNFEFSLCNWMPDSDIDGINWERHFPRKTSLPNKDHTTNLSVGYYLYMAKSTPLGSRTAAVRSGDFLFNGDKCLEIWYNIDHTSQLRIYQSTVNVNRSLSWTNMNGSNNWQHVNVSLKRGLPYTIVIEGTVGNSSNAYIAIDDTDIRDRSCNESQPVSCNFEQNFCNFEVKPDFDLPWTRGNTEETGIRRPSFDHTKGENGYYAYVQSSNYVPPYRRRLIIPIDNVLEVGCLSVWYYMYGDYPGHLFIYTVVNMTEEIMSVIFDTRTVMWSRFQANVYNVTKIIFEYNSTDKNKGGIALDDVYISPIICAAKPISDDCVKNDEHLHIQCPVSYLWNETIAVDLKIPKSCHTTSDQIHRKLQNIFNQCNYRSICTFTPDEPINDDLCLKMTKRLLLDYSCIDKSVSVTTSTRTASSTPQTNDTTFLTTFERQTISTSQKAGDTTFFTILDRQTISTSQQTGDITDTNQSSSPSSTSVIGIVIGVLLSLIALSVFLVIAVVYFRRYRYAEKKGHSIVANEDSHSDYTGRQNIAFSPEVNVTTQTDYCEIRKSKLNEHYHDISDTFSPSINTTNDDEYSEIANVVNSTNSNPNPSTNYQHQYITLDPNATGFDRSNPQTNLNNSNETNSLTGGDDYAILDPDDLNESKNNTPNVLSLSDNYVVLDPNETGYNRQENTDRVCNYELSTSFNPTETSENPYDVSKDETYDTSSNSRHKEKENNIYSHTIDNVYDTAGNQRKKEESDGTYDHFFGQKSEDDYDISKPI